MIVDTRKKDEGDVTLICLSEEEIQNIQKGRIICLSDCYVGTGHTVNLRVMTEDSYEAVLQMMNQ